MLCGLSIFHVIISDWFVCYFTKLEDFLDVYKRYACLEKNI